MPKYLTYSLLFFLIFACAETVKNEAKNNTVNPEPTKEAAIDTNLIDFIMGKFNPEKNKDFIKIPLEYADQEGRFMHKEAFEAFVRMSAEAASDGISLKIVSAARNFDYQKGIWERKWTGETKLSTGEDASVSYPDPSNRARNILNYSSMPGTSRHHWGTDIDLNKFNNAWFESGDGLKLFNWLEKNAHLYGYCRPYTSKDSLRPFGYNEEKWHWSYLPISEGLTNAADSLLKNKMIAGFKGSEVANQLDIVNKYVLGINHSCKH